MAVLHMASAMKPTRILSDIPSYNYSSNIFCINDVLPGLLRGSSGVSYAPLLESFTPGNSLEGLPSRHIHPRLGRRGFLYGIQHTTTYYLTKKPALYFMILSVFREKLLLKNHLQLFGYFLKPARPERFACTFNNFFRECFIG